MAAPQTSNFTPRDKINFENWILEGITSRKGQLVSLAFIECFLRQKQGATVDKRDVREILKRLEISGKLVKIGSMYTILTNITENHRNLHNKTTPQRFDCSQDKRNFEKWILEGVTNRKGQLVSLAFIECFLRQKQGATVDKEDVREILKKLETSGKLVKLGSMYTVKLMSPTLLSKLKEKEGKMMGRSTKSARKFKVPQNRP